MVCNNWLVIINAYYTKDVRLVEADQLAVTKNNIYGMLLCAIMNWLDNVHSSA